MKIAVTSQGEDMKSLVDQRFGRAKYFIAVDLESGEFQYHSNMVNVNAAQGAGIQSAQKVADLGVEGIITGHVGPKAWSVLKAAGIKVFTVSNQVTVEEAVAQIKENKLNSIDSADVESHWI